MLYVYIKIIFFEAESDRSELFEQRKKKRYSKESFFLLFFAKYNIHLLLNTYTTTSLSSVSEDYEIRL